MSRDATKRAQKASDRDLQLSKQYGATSDTLSGQLTPIYTQQATNPQGMTPQEMNDARTATMESTGGGVAAVTGEGNLEAARSGNAGGYQAALADASRRGIATNASKALQLENLNTALKESQRESGVGGLQHLQSQNQGATLAAMGLDTGAINAQTEAGKSGWFQNMLGLTNAIGSANPVRINYNHNG